MPEKRDTPPNLPERFTEAPQIFIGEELVHDPALPDTGEFDRVLRKAQRQQTKDFLDELRQKWHR